MVTPPPTPTLTSWIITPEPTFILGPTPTPVVITPGPSPTPEVIYITPEPTQIPSSYHEAKIIFKSKQYVYHRSKFTIKLGKFSERSIVFKVNDSFRMKINCSNKIKNDLLKKFKDNVFDLSGAILHKDLKSITITINGSSLIIK